MKKTMTLQEHMSNIAAKGGKSTLKKRGRSHFVMMAKIGWKNRRKAEKVKNAR